MQPGKAGPLAEYVHVAADLHAFQHPELQSKPPQTERELARFLSTMSEEAAVDYSRIIRQRFARRLPVNSDMTEMRNELVRAARAFFEMYNPQMRAAVQETYALGMLGAQIALSNYGAVPPPGAGFEVNFNAPDLAAMAAIANDNFSDLAGQTTNMIDTAVGILRTDAAKIIRHRLAQGVHPTQVARELEKQLVRRGFKPSAAMEKFNKWRDQKKNPYNGVKPNKRLGTWKEISDWVAEQGYLKFVDRAGREWDLRKYCEMAAHTKLMIAKNEGTRNTMHAAGVHHFMFSVHGTDCPICDPHEGGVYWTGVGDAKGYPVGPDIPLHPNCGHATIPYVLAAYE